MILSNIFGNVYSVTPAMKNTTLKPFTNVNNMVLGDTFPVPKSLGPHGGELWVAAEDEEKVYSISAGQTPKISAIVDIPNAGNVSAIPHEPEEFGCSGGAYFAADRMTRGGRILECPKSAFRGTCKVLCRPYQDSRCEQG
jgi:hypothetical protein